MKRKVSVPVITNVHTTNLLCNNITQDSLHSVSYTHLRAHET